MPILSTDTETEAKKCLCVKVPILMLSQVYALIALGFFFCLMLLFSRWFGLNIGTDHNDTSFHVSGYNIYDLSQALNTCFRPIKMTSLILLCSSPFIDLNIFISQTSTLLNPVIMAS